jgi:transcription factor SPN1
MLISSSRAAQLAIRQSNSQIPSAVGLSSRELDMERLVAMPASSRARLEISNTSYTVAPKSTFDPSKGIDPSSRPIGASGMDAFRKLTAKKR